MKKNLELFVKGLVYLSFFVPLVVLPTSFIFPFIVPKVLLFRSLVTLMAAGYALLWYLDPKQYRPRLTPMFIALAAFVASFAISTFVGVDPYHSFWDNHERMLGLFTIAHYFVYFVVIGGIFKTWSDWRQLFWMLLLAGSVVMFIGILQVGNPQLLLNQGSRIASTLGNPIYVGGYGLFLAFVSALLFIRERNWVWRVVAALLGFLALLAMIYSGTRGSALGFVAGAGVATLLYALLAKENPRARQGAGAALVIVVFLVAGLFAGRNTDFVRQIPSVNRAVNTSFTDIKSSARWIAWDIAWKSFKERPVFGWGPNNFFYAFNAHYNPRSLDFGYGETWFDNAHNIIMNTLAVQGAAGLISYLALFGVGIAVLARARRATRQDVAFLAIGSGFLVAHLVQNVTVFENLTSYFYFMVWLAFINRAASSFGAAPASAAPQLPLKTMAPSRTVGTVGASAAMVAALIWIFIFSIQPARANMHTLRVLVLLNKNSPEATPAMQAALEFSSPHIDDIRNDIGRTVDNVIMAHYRDLGPERVMTMIDVMYPALQKNMTLHPLDIRVLMLLGEMARIRSQISGSAEAMKEAENYLERALALSPRRQQIIYGLSEVKLAFKKNQEVEKLLRQVIADNPRVGESYVRLALLYQQLGWRSQALGVIAEGRKNNVVFTDNEEGLITQVVTASTTAGKK